MIVWTKSSNKWLKITEMTIPKKSAVEGRWMISFDGIEMKGGYETTESTAKDPYITVMGDWDKVEKFVEVLTLILCDAFDRLDIDEKYNYMRGRVRILYPEAEISGYGWEDALAFYSLTHSERKNIVTGSQEGIVMRRNLK
jgi:hypothetical protein